MNVRSFFPFFALSIVLLAGGCKDVDTVPKSDVQLTFKSLYDGQTLETAKDYTYGTFPVRFSRFNVYISDITLLKGSEEVKLSEVEYLDFTPEDATTNVTKPVVIKYPNAALTGTYTGLRIGFGVKPDLNAKTPADFAPGHPLYRESEYWPGWKSYIFSKIEGAGFPNGAGTTALDLTYHCGGNQCYKTFTFQRDIVVADNSGQVTVAIDLKDLFTFNGQLFDIETTPTSSHGSGGVGLMEDLMGNFGNAIELQ